MSWMGMGMGMGNHTCLLGRGARALVLSRASLAGDWQPVATQRSPVLPREPSSLPRPPHGLGTAAVSPVVVKIPATLTRESSGLYTVSSTLFAHVTREDRNSLYHCTVHYWLQGQRRAVESRRVNVTVFCESGAEGHARYLVPHGGVPHGGALHRPFPLPPPPDPAQHVKLQVMPSSALVKEGDDVKLVCEADGNPAPVFSFYKRDVRLEGT